MKLKKIASLMLAGIMAVSMLAACGEASSNSTETPDVTPVTGVAATVNGELNANKDKISFTDNDVVTDLLESYFAENPIKAGTWTNAANGVVVNNNADFNGLKSSLTNVLGAKNYNFSTNGFAGNTNEDGTYFELYIVGSSYVSEENALRMVGQHLDDVKLADDNKAETDPATKDLSYTGTVAAIEAESKGGTESVWVIVATITQTSADK